MSSIPKDYVGAKFGMWLFLFTEIILFGGLFILYAVYFSQYPEDWAKAGKELNIYFGGGNTIVLVSSSLFMALSITAIQKNEKKKSMWFLIITIACALIFLINKYFEWSAKFHHGIYPDSAFLNSLPPGEIIFFGMYFAMTGLHGIHVILGGGLLLYVLFMIKNDKVNSTDFVLLENAGLYWHIVDLIWIYLFPLFYLII